MNRWRAEHYHLRYTLTPAAEALLGASAAGEPPDTYRSPRDAVWVLTAAGTAALDEALPAPRQEAAR